jgi:phenylacetate-coenzyme A ligase PaaK-like adenylate-forming protein
MQWVNQEALQTLLEFVSENTYSSFYRDKYTRAGVSRPTVENFLQLPTLSRRELTDTPVADRTFVAPTEVRFVAFTSGTSSRAPLITPFGDVKNYFVEPSLGLSVTRPLIIYPPLNKNFGASFIQQCRQAKAEVSPMFADFQNLANSALIAKEMQCDSMYATPTIAALFAEHAQARGIAGNFKLLALSSETLTGARRQELAGLYPNAVIANLYASSEIGQFAMVPCERMLERGVSEFHLIAEALAAVEIIDGELVVSYGLNHAMPLVRYRTGDFFEEGAPCDCGCTGPTLRWSHRDTERVRLNGIEFTVDEADRVMGELPHMPVRDYQVHFKPGQGAAVHMHIEIVGDPAHAPLAAIERDLPASWRISSTATLKDALERGLLSGITITIVPAVSDRAAKAKRFVTHVR